MADLEQNNLTADQENLVRNYLSGRLDPQMGRAEARFRQMLAQPQAPAEERHSIFRLPNRFNRFTLGFVGAALAASLAALWAGPALFPGATPATPGIRSSPVSPPISPTPVFIQQDVQSQTFDDGTYMTNDNSAFRVLRRRDLERTRVFDANQQLQDEQVIPQDHVIYVPVKTY